MRTAEKIIIIAFIAVWAVACAYVMDGDLQAEKKVDDLDARVSKAERTLVMLHTCFPNGHYNADAAPTCPTFKQMVIDEADKGEK